MLCEVLRTLPLRLFNHLDRPRQQPLHLRRRTAQATALQTTRWNAQKPYFRNFLARDISGVQVIIIDLAIPFLGFHLFWSESAHVSRFNKTAPILVCVVLLSRLCQRFQLYRIIPVKNSIKTFLLDQQNSCWTCKKICWRSLSPSDHQPNTNKQNQGALPDM